MLNDFYLTLNGPLSVLKLIPGMYLSQTGKPLKNERGKAVKKFQVPT